MGDVIFYQKLAYGKVKALPHVFFLPISTLTEIRVMYVSGVGWVHRRWSYCISSAFSPMASPSAVFRGKVCIAAIGRGLVMVMH